jgi:hypothetical protein
MLSFIILSTLTGAVLGLRFKVLILVPAIVLVAAVTLGVGITHGDGLGSLLLAMLLAITGLQMGYFGGTVTRLVIRGDPPPQGFAQTHGGSSTLRALKT